MPRWTGNGGKQSENANGNPLAMVNVLALDLKLCLEQWLASEKRFGPVVLREQLGRLFERYPSTQLLTMDARYLQRYLCQAIVSRESDYPVRILEEVKHFTDAAGRIAATLPLRALYILPRNTCTPMSIIRAD